MWHINASKLLFVEIYPLLSLFASRQHLLSKVGSYGNGYISPIVRISLVAKGIFIDILSSIHSVNKFVVNSRMSPQK